MVFRRRPQRGPGEPGAEGASAFANEALSYIDAWRMIAEVTGARRPWRTSGAPGMFLAGRLGDLVAWVRGIEGDANSAAVGMAKLEHHFTYARATAELGYKPRPVREGVEAAWKWFVDRGYAKAKKKVAKR